MTLSIKPPRGGSVTLDAAVSSHDASAVWAGWFSLSKARSGKVSTNYQGCLDLTASRLYHCRIAVSKNGKQYWPLYVVSAASAASLSFPVVWTGPPPQADLSIKLTLFPGSILLVTKLAFLSQKVQMSHSEPSTPPPSPRKDRYGVWGLGEWSCRQWQLVIPTVFPTPLFPVVLLPIGLIQQHFLSWFIDWLIWLCCYAFSQKPSHLPPTHQPFQSVCLQF